MTARGELEGWKILDRILTWRRFLKTNPVRVYWHKIVTTGRNSSLQSPESKSVRIMEKLAVMQIEETRSRWTNVSFLLLRAERVEGFRIFLNLIYIYTCMSIWYFVFSCLVLNEKVERLVSLYFFIWREEFLSYDKTSKFLPKKNYKNFLFEFV